VKIILSQTSKVFLRPKIKVSISSNISPYRKFSKCQ
jgi:hypothetical protein